GPRTTQPAVARAQDYLRSPARMPTLLKKAVPGYVVGRIAAAVWRQCIDLVLEGVIDVDELVRAVSLGPALGWAAAGPHLAYHVAAGDGGVDRKSTRLNSSHLGISYAVFCLKKKKKKE